MEERSFRHGKLFCEISTFVESHLDSLKIYLFWSLFSLIDSALCYVVDALIIIVLPTSSQSVIFVGPPYCSHRVDTRSALKHKQRKVNYYWCQVVGVQPVQYFKLFTLPFSWQLKQIGNIIKMEDTAPTIRKSNFKLIRAEFFFCYELLLKLGRKARFSRTNARVLPDS